MALGSLAGESSLPVGEGKAFHFTFDYNVYHVAPMKWRCDLYWDQKYEGNGTTPETAICYALNNLAASMLGEEMDRIKEAEDERQKSREATRNIVGNDVSSEELRDAYLGDSPTTEGGQ